VLTEGKVTGVPHFEQKPLPAVSGLPHFGQKPEPLDTVTTSPTSLLNVS
jgi:hypothetical protein